MPAPHPLNDPILAILFFFFFKIPLCVGLQSAMSVLTEKKSTYIFWQENIMDIPHFNSVTFFSK